MARLIFALIFAAIVAAALGEGFYRSLKSGVISNRYGTSRRDREQWGYWTGMSAMAFGCVVLVSGILLLVIIWAW
ncbi:MAG: hypothetical protein WBD07_00030 [Vicinamibacterales bacterium]